MKRFLALLLVSSGIVSAQVAPVPTIDAIGGHPFSITKKWIIGGTGNWDTMTMDPTAGQLFIAHGPTIQVVDVSSGSVIGTVGGFSEAHAVVLDDSGSFGFASDGPADLVRVFDRTSFKVVANIPTGPRPRALALDPQTGLLLAICSGGGGRGRNQTPPGAIAGRRGANPPPSQPTASTSVITVIDPAARQPLENLTVHGLLALAQADGMGHVYVAVEDRGQVARIDVQAIAAQIKDANGTKVGGNALEYRPQIIRLPAECHDPRSVAVDGNHQRLFVACNNMKMAVMNGATGETIKSLTIGPGPQTIAYDSSRNLIFTANGGGYGSLSVITQDVTDTYNVVQNLPTLQQARTLAVNSSTGEVYLVTSLYGAKVDYPPVNGLGTLKMIPVESSFQVLVIGN